MSKFIFAFGKDDIVLEQVANINLSDFTNDSALPSNLEPCFRRLTVSSSKNILPDSKSFESFPNIKNRRNGSSVSASSSFSRNLSEKSRPFNSSLEKTWTFWGAKRTPIVTSRADLGDFSDSSSSRFPRTGHGDFSVSGKIYSNSSRFSQRIESSSSSSFTTSGSTSPSSHQDQKPKSKSKILISWFDKFSPAKAMGCLKHSPDIKGKELQQKREKQRRKANKAIKKLKRQNSKFINNPL